MKHIFENICYVLSVIAVWVTALLAVPVAIVLMLKYFMWLSRTLI
jgi:hypothetical protein